MMSGEEIFEAVHKQRSAIRRHYDKIEKLQEDCPHRDLKKTNGANTGNYDPYDDYYWVDCKCMDCGKAWREDQ